MAEIIVTEKNFESEVLKSDIPVLVDFWASWCGPCKMLAPVVEALAHELDGKVKIGKINVDEEPSLAMQFRVASIPTLLLFKGGQVADKMIGYAEKEEILQMLN